MRLSTARATTLLLTLAAGATAFIPDLLAAPPTMIMFDAPSAPNAIEVADLRGSAAQAAPAAMDAAGDSTAGVATDLAAGTANLDSTGTDSMGTDSTRPGPDDGSGANRPDRPGVEPAVDADIPVTSVKEKDPANSGADSHSNNAASNSGDVRLEDLEPATAAGSTDAGIATDGVAATQPAPLLVSTVGDSSMMFMNAGLAAALGPERWQPVPTEYDGWTNGTGGFDRHGCGPTGDSLRIYFSQSVGPLEPRFNHPDEVEHTCDWRRWIPGGLELAQSDVVVASWGPTTMWGWERDGQMVDLTDPVIRASVAQAHIDVRAAMMAAGVQHVIWVAYPPVLWRPYFDRNREEQPWSSPAVADELFELLTELGDTVVDLRDMKDPANFGDGLHFTETASAVAAQRILAALPAGS